MQNTNRVQGSGFRVQRSKRPGVTIIEVLFSILVTSVGLLGAIAVFPVASAQARRAKVNDAAAASGRAAVHMVDTMGMRRPFDRWYAWNTTSSQWFVATPATLDTRQSYCLDTRFLVRNTTNISATGTTRAQFFPYVAPVNAPSAFMHRIAFFPGTLDASSATPSLRDQFDRINNVIPDALGNPAYGRNILLADSIFTFNDDLSFLRPGLDDVSNLTLPNGTKLTNDRSQPSFQIFPALAGGNTGPRPTQGHMSWMATLVPKIDYNANTGSDQFVMSIVVFNDRPTDLYMNANNVNLLERTVQAIPLGDGSTGGEFLLYAPGTATAADQAIAEERLKVRTNSWMMLAGMQNGIGRFQWYRVAHHEPEIEYSIATAAGGGLPALPERYQIYVTLMGQDWSFAATQATLMEGVVAVYEKTIRLDYGSTY